MTRWAPTEPPTAVRPARRRVPALGGMEGMGTMPSAAVKGAEGGRSARSAFTLDSRVPGGGGAPPDKRGHAFGLSPLARRRSAIGDCRYRWMRFIWGAAPPRRTAIVKTSRRSRDAAFGGLDIGGKRDIHASPPPQRPHSRPVRPDGRRRPNQGDSRGASPRFIWGAAPPRRTPIVKTSRRSRDAAFGGLDIGGKRDIHASSPSRRPHSRPVRPDGRRRPNQRDSRGASPRFIWGPAPPRRTPIVKTSRRSRDAAFGGLDIGGKRGIHASFPPRRSHSRPGRPCGRRRAA
jgi:hypothetical protein